MEKLVRSIARRFGCKNYFERSSKVFHKLRANFPQVFPQVRSNPVSSKLILPTVRIRRCDLSQKLIGRWMVTYVIECDRLFGGRQTAPWGIQSWLSVYPCIRVRISVVPSFLLLIQLLRLTTLIRSLN